MTEGLDAPGQTGQSERGGPHIDSPLPRTEIDRDTDQIHRPPCVIRHCRYSTDRAV